MDLMEVESEESKETMDSEHALVPENVSINLTAEATTDQTFLNAGELLGVSGKTEPSSTPLVPVSLTQATSDSASREDACSAKPISTCRTTQKSEYHVKWIQWKQKKTPIITQNENGPCPLIAIINVLILKGRIVIPNMVEIVTSDQLMEYLGDCIIASIPKNIPEGAQLNYEQNMHDAMSVLPKLQTGLDVNVRFTGVSHFEYTPECIVFDLLHIPLYHGWLMDPQSPEVLTAIGNCSYNQLVEKIINNKASQRPEVVTEALIGESFLEKTASQLTYHGLCELTSLIKEDELCVLFRNNHFICLHKHKNELFQLVTDQGFLTESNVVWETLNNIEGDGQFVDSAFVTVPPKVPNENEDKLGYQMDREHQVDQDYLVALSLQEEQQSRQNREMEWETFKEKSLGGAGTEMSDEELARRLQEEEERMAAAVSNRQGSQQSDSSALPQEEGTMVEVQTPLRPQPGGVSPSRSGSRQRNSRNCPIL